jgi:hypothetical protein
VRQSAGNHGDSVRPRGDGRVDLGEQLVADKMRHRGAVQNGGVGIAPRGASGFFMPTT